MSTRRKLLFAAILGLNLLALVVMTTSSSVYKVDFSSVLEIWGDVFRDADKLGLTVTAIPVDREIEIGDETVSLFHPADSDPRLPYLNDVGQRVAANVSRRRIPYKFHIMPVSWPNAFALPGGHILVTDGLLRMVASEAELAAILGHEVAHIDFKHCIENLQYEIFLKHIVGSDLARISTLGYRIAALGFSELQEREADRAAITFMAEAGYSPIEAVRIYRRIQGASGHTSRARHQPTEPATELGQAVSDALRDYFATHPDTLSRMRDIEAIFDQNMAAWKGHRFYIGRSNLKDLVARSKDERADEFTTYSESDPAFLLARGEVAVLAENWRSAVNYLTRAIEAGAIGADVFFDRAKAYAALSDGDKAVADAERVAELTQAAIGEHVAVADSSIKIGDKGAAAAALLSATLDADQFVAVLRLLESLPAGDQLGAKRIVERARAAAVEGYEGIGERLYRLQLYADAAGVYAKVLGLDEINLVAIKGRALSQVKLGQKPAALDDLAKLRLRLPDEPELLRIKTMVYRVAGDTKRADREYGRYVRMRDQKVPPLSDNDWADLEQFWDDAKYEDFKAFAFTVNVKNDSWYRTWGLDWPQTAGANAVRFCEQKAGQPCRLYALGEEVVWGLNEAQLQTAYNVYEMSRRQSIP